MLSDAWMSERDLLDQSGHMNKDHTNRVSFYTRWQPLDRASGSVAVQHTSDAPQGLVRHYYFFVF
jgi:hypothetical protein